MPESCALSMQLTARTYDAKIPMLDRPMKANEGEDHDWKLGATQSEWGRDVSGQSENSLNGISIKET